MHHRWFRATIWCAVTACTSPPVPTRPAPPPAAPPPPAPRPVPPTSATAVIRDLVGAKVGSATFNDTHGGVLISGTISGLGLGAHGLHIHEFGKCQPPFATAGGHYNPEAKHHGFKSATGPHAGDLPNIELPAAGTLHFEFIMPGVTLKGPHGMIGPGGASIVVHTSRDDYVTDPAGNSGSRQACGVIVPR